jgi:HD-GYP domain-containing protein (c-di-GMP phosphodiesterase class II)
MGIVTRPHSSLETGLDAKPRSTADVKFTFARLAAARGARGENPGARPAAAPPAPAARDEERKSLYRQAGHYLEQVFAAVRQRKPFEIETGLGIVRRMSAESCPRDPLFSLALHLDDRLQFAVHHSVNVAVYAVKMAPHLGYDARRQEQIGLAGLLHDVGMALVPESLVNKPGPLSQAELNTIKERPNTAYRILQGLGPDCAYLAECAAQVCERLDGTGYPRGLQAGEINEFAQIIGLLDLYEALVHSRPNRDKLSFFDAVKYIFKSCKTQFERTHMKALLSLFTVFPMHSYVRLNSDAIGKVVETYPDQPLRPKVRIVFDSQRRKVLTERIVTLAEEPLLNIVACVSQQEIKDVIRGVPAGPAPSPQSCPVVTEPVL